MSPGGATAVRAGPEARRDLILGSNFTSGGWGSLVNRYCSLSERSRWKHPDYDAAYAEISAVKKCKKRWRKCKHVGGEGCGAIVYVPIRCEKRSCTDCARILAARAKSVYRGPLSRCKALGMLTFTVPNAPDARSLRVALSVLMDGWRKIRRSKVWPKGARGVWSLEITWSPDRGYHPHLHVVGHIPFLSLDGLHREWNRLTGALHRPDIRRAGSEERRAGLIREGLKYIFKPWECDEDTAKELVAHLAGKRTHNNFGTWPDGERFKKEEEEEAPPSYCPRCGDVYEWREWEQEVLEEDEVDFQRDGPLWADVYFGFKREGRAGP